MAVPTKITGAYKNRAENYSKLLEFYLFVYFYLTLKPSQKFERLKMPRPRSSSIKFFYSESKKPVNTLI